MRPRTSGSRRSVTVAAVRASGFPPALWCFSRCSAPRRSRRRCLAAVHQPLTVAHGLHSVHFFSLSNARTISLCFQLPFSAAARRTPLLGDLCVSGWPAPRVRRPLFPAVVRPAVYPVPPYPFRHTRSSLLPPWHPALPLAHTPSPLAPHLRGSACCALVRFTCSSTSSGPVFSLGVGPIRCPGLPWCVLRPRVVHAYTSLVLVLPRRLVLVPPSFPWSFTPFFSRLLEVPGRLFLSPPPSALYMSQHYAVSPVCPLSSCDSLSRFLPTPHLFTFPSSASSDLHALAFCRV